MAFITDSQLKVELAGNLKVDPAAIPPGVWDEVIESSNVAAYQEIIGALLARGYTMAQISAWDRRVEFNADLGLFWCLVKGAGLHGNDPTFIDKLDRRKELLTCPVICGGSLVAPGTAGGVVGYGTLDTEDDTYARPTFSGGKRVTDGWPKW